MSSYQRIVVVGHLGKDPELKTLQNGQVCKFSIAVTEKWANGEHTEWFNVDCFGKNVENHAKFLSKGSKALVEGTLRTNEKDGKRFTSLNALRVVYLDSAKSKGEAAQAPASEFDPNDIPF